MNDMYKEYDLHINKLKELSYMHDSISLDEYNQTLEYIYEKTKNLVFSICLSYMRDYMLAEDMMEDTYILIRRNVNQYNTGTNPIAWITTIAKNTCLNEIKRRKKVDYLSDFFENEENLNKNDSYEENRKETPLLNIALKILKEKELLVLLPHIIDNKKLVEIANDLHLPEGTVRWRYNSCLNKIRKYLERSKKDA